MTPASIARDLSGDVTVIFPETTWSALAARYGVESKGIAE